MKLTKRFIIVLLTICIVYLTSIPIFAEDKSFERVNDEIDIIHSIGDVSGEIVEVTANANTLNTDIKLYDIHNFLSITITPGENGIGIRLKNIGIDKLSYVQFTIERYTYNGTPIDSAIRSQMNVGIGSTDFYWVVEKYDTVQEKIVVSGYAEDGATYVFEEATVYRNNFVGGAYGSMEAYEGERHHIPSNSVTAISQYSGPAIRMLKEDHMDTASYGNSTSAKNYRATEAALIAEGKFDEAMQMGIDNIRDLFDDKYDRAIEQMIAYAVSKGYIEAGTVE